MRVRTLVYSPPVGEGGPPTACGHFRFPGGQPVPQVYSLRAAKVG
ncbi:hypothetical protein [Peterkaempfera sp. SMS 1(5)a]